MMTRVPVLRRFSSAATSRPVISGISMSVMKTSGLCSKHGSQGFFTVARSGHDADVAFDLEQRGERAQTPCPDLRRLPRGSSCARF